MKRPLVLAVLLSLSLACSTAGPQQRTSGLVHIVVAATTDVHGNLSSTRSRKGYEIGGLPLLAGYVDALRAAHGDRFILLDSGDMWQGTLASNLEEGEGMVRGYSRIGYNAAVLGNHEFDFGPVGEKSAPRSPEDDPVGVVRRNASIANFPFLCTNILERSTGLPPEWCRPSIVINAGGVNIGVVGAITETTPFVTQPANVAHLRFVDAAEALAAEARVLHANEDVAAIVAVAHIGAQCESTDTPESPLAECRGDSPLFRLASALPRGAIDMIAGGHSHNRARHYVNGVALTQAPVWGRALSVVDLWIDPRRGRVVRTEVRPHIPICSTFDETSGTCRSDQTGSMTLEGQPIRPSAEVARVIQPSLDRAEAKQREPLGIRLAEPLVHSRSSESPLANVVMRAMLAEAPEATIAMVNSGGIRAPLRELEPLFGDIYRILPFDNTLTIFDLSGEELAQMVSLATDLDDYGLLHLYGLEVTVRPGDARGDRVVSIRDAAGNPIDPAKRYKVATVDFLAAGGDGLDPLTSTLRPEQIQLLGRTLRDVVIDDLQRRSAEGPITPLHTGWLRKAEEQVSGIRYRVSGIRYQVSDIRYQISGIRYQVSDIRYQISGIREYQV